MAELVPIDPRIPNVKCRVFYTQVKGIRNLFKRSIINEAMSLFVKNHKRKSPSTSIISSEKGNFDLEYQPNTFAQHLRTLFGIFKDQGIVYNLNEFEKKGDFKCWLHQKWKEVAKKRTDFGNLPFQAQFDETMLEKIHSAVLEKKLDYKNNYRHFTMLIIILLGHSHMLRGGEEVSHVVFILFFMYTK